MKINIILALDFVSEQAIDSDLLLDIVSTFNTQVNREGWDRPFSYEIVAAAVTDDVSIGEFTVSREPLSIYNQFSEEQQFSDYWTLDSFKTADSREAVLFKSSRAKKTRSAYMADIVDFCERSFDEQLELSL